MANVVEHLPWQQEDQWSSARSPSVCGFDPGEYEKLRLIRASKLTMGINVRENGSPVTLQRVKQQRMKESFGLYIVILNRGKNTDQAIINY